jgi:hypothetical protein
MLGVVGTLGVAWTAPARADDGAAQPAAEARDVVRLKNGGMLRGTISELVPGDSVTIITASGKTREFPMAEVDYAGPADKDPSASAAPSAVTTAEAPTKSTTTSDNDKVSPEVTVKTDRAQLQLESSPPGLTFHRANSSAIATNGQSVAIARGYQRLCTAPCEASLPAGTEVIALSKEGRFPIEAEAVTLPAGKSRVTGTLESRAGLRGAGWAIAAGGLLIGGILVFTSKTTEEKCYGTDSCIETSGYDKGKFLAGVVIASGGVGVGLVLAFRPDVAKVEVATRNPTLALPPARGFAFSGTM